MFPLITELIGILHVDIMYFTEHDKRFKFK